MVDVPLENLHLLIGIELSIHLCRFIAINILRRNSTLRPIIVLAIDLNATGRLLTIHSIVVIVAEIKNATGHDLLIHLVTTLHICVRELLDQIAIGLFKCSVTADKALLTWR